MFRVGSFRLPDGPERGEAVDVVPGQGMLVEPRFQAFRVPDLEVVVQAHDLDLGPAGPSSREGGAG